MIAYVVTAMFPGCGARAFTTIVYHAGSKRDVTWQLGRDGWSVKRVRRATKDDVLEVPRYEDVLRDARAEALRLTHDELARRQQLAVEEQRRADDPQKAQEQEPLVGIKQPPIMTVSKFRVQGAIRDSGDDVRVVLDAASVSDALSKAKQLGILVAEIEILEDALVQPSHDSPRVRSGLEENPRQPVCPICGAIGSLYRRQKADMVLAVLLLILFFPAWIIYRAFTAGEAMYCRKCGAKVADM